MWLFCTLNRPPRTVHPHPHPTPPPVTCATFPHFDPPTTLWPESKFPKSTISLPTFFSIFIHLMLKSNADSLEESMYSAWNGSETLITMYNRFDKIIMSVPFPPLVSAHENNAQIIAMRPFSFCLSFFCLVHKCLTFFIIFFSISRSYLFSLRSLYSTQHAVKQTFPTFALLLRMRALPPALCVYNEWSFHLYHT